MGDERKKREKMSPDCDNEHFQALCKELQRAQVEPSHKPMSCVMQVLAMSNIQKIMKQKGER